MWIFVFHKRHDEYCRSGFCGQKLVVHYLPSCLFNRFYIRGNLNKIFLGRIPTLSSWRLFILKPFRVKVYRFFFRVLVPSHRRKPLFLSHLATISSSYSVLPNIQRKRSGKCHRTANKRREYPKRNKIVNTSK